jgi:hypothetical protein
LSARRGNFALVGSTLGALLALLLAWNGWATRFDAEARGLRREGDVWDRAARGLSRTLETLPAPLHPRVVLYGSSQIAVVKREPEGSLGSTPHRLRPALAARGIPTEIVDFSDGGQQMIESAVVHFASEQTSQPCAVVIGVGLFSLRDAAVRATLFEGVPTAAIADAMRAALPRDADPAAIATLLGWADTVDAGEPSTSDATIQQRLDQRIDAWLNRHVAAYANRRTMYREVIDLPFRLAFERHNRSRQGRILSGTYSIGPAYAPSLLALETIMRSMADRDVPVLVVVLPFDSARPPIPYPQETQDRVVSDVRAIAARNAARVLDLGGALSSRDFGDYEDGSPDNLHYDAAGHAIVADRIAAELADAFGERLREPH